MTTYPHVALVAEPEPGAEVLFDFNRSWDTRNGILNPGFTIGIPSIDGDPDAVGVEYGPRTVQFTGRIMGDRHAALSALARLSRLLLRSEPGWLLFQLDWSTPPVWFELLRPEPGDLSFDNVFVDLPDRDIWELQVSLPAEPFAVGERVTGEPVALSNNPLTAGCEIPLPEIKGDAPAPLRIRVQPGGGVAPTSAAAGTSWLMSVMPFKAGASWSPIVWNVGGSDGFTNGADTVTGTSVDHVGGNFKTISFATNTDLVTRISGTVPAGVPIGRYKVLVRATRTDASSTFSLRFGQKVLAYFYDQPAVTMDRPASPSPDHATWVDLGEFQFPRSVPDLPPTQTGFPPSAPDISLQVGRLSGTGGLRIDAIKLVPVDLLSIGHDPATTLTTFLPVLGIAHAGVWDGARESIWSFNSLGILNPATFHPRGAFPVAAPGADNVLTVMPHVGGGRPYFNDHNTDVLTDVNTVEWSYQPRWLYLAGG